MINNIISENSRIRNKQTECFSIGEYSIIDDYCYISRKFFVGNFFHIASNCTISGGIDSIFKAGSFGGLSSGVRVFCKSSDFVNGIATCLPKEYKEYDLNLKKENVILEDYVTIGANSVIMPGVYIPEGTVIGACSFVRCKKLLPWSVYAGNPLKYICKRNKELVLKQVENILNAKNNKSN